MSPRHASLAHVPRRLPNDCRMANTGCLSAHSKKCSTPWKYARKTGETIDSCQIVRIKPYSQWKKATQVLLSPHLLQIWTERRSAPILPMTPSQAPSAFPCGCHWSLAWLHMQWTFIQWGKWVDLILFTSGIKFLFLKGQSHGPFVTH